MYWNSWSAMCVCVCTCGIQRKSQQRMIEPLLARYIASPEAGVYHFPLSVSTCAVLLCLTLLASFFLPSRLSLKHIQYMVIPGQLCRNMSYAMGDFILSYINLLFAAKGVLVHCHCAGRVSANTCTCTRGSSFFLGKVTALGVLCCFALLFV